LGDVDGADAAVDDLVDAGEETERRVGTTEHFDAGGDGDAD